VVVEFTIHNFGYWEDLKSRKNQERKQEDVTTYPIRPYYWWVNSSTTVKMKLQEIRKKSLMTFNLLQDLLVAKQHQLICDKMDDAHLVKSSQARSWPEHEELIYLLAKTKSKNLKNKTKSKTEEVRRHVMNRSE